MHAIFWFFILNDRNDAEIWLNGCAPPFWHGMDAWMDPLYHTHITCYEIRNKYPYFLALVGSYKFAFKVLSDLPQVLYVKSDFFEKINTPTPICKTKNLWENHIFSKFQTSKTPDFSSPIKSQIRRKLLLLVCIFHTRCSLQWQSWFYGRKFRSKL